MTIHKPGDLPVCLDSISFGSKEKVGTDKVDVRLDLPLEEIKAFYI